MTLLHKSKYSYELKDESAYTKVKNLKKKGYKEIDYDLLGSRLKILRRRMGFTQEEMAMYINRVCAPKIKVGWKRYHRWENGRSLKRESSYDFLYKLSKEFHVPIQFFYNRDWDLPGIWRKDGVIEKGRPEHLGAKDNTVYYKNLDVYVVNYVLRGNDADAVVLAESRFKAIDMVKEKYNIGEVENVKKVDQKPCVIA